MTLDLLFWIIYLFALLFGLYSEYQAGQPYPWPRGFRHVVIFILLGLLGARVFGGPIKG
jgi:hypothetical protein